MGTAIRQSGAPPLERAHPVRVLYGMLCLVAVATIAISLPLTSTKVGISILAAWCLLIWIAIAFARARFHYIAIMWVAVYPYCYYYFSYPKGRSIFTADRAFVVLLLIELLIASRRAGGAPLSHDLRISAYLWSLYLLLCSLSLIGHKPSGVLPSYRFLIDGLLMPAIFGLYAVRYFPAQRHLNKLHLSACILGLGLCISGLVELFTGLDLFPWSGAVPLFTETHIRRPDGPFELPVVLSVVALLCFFFIIYLRQLMPKTVSSFQSLLHKGGSLAAFAAAVLPLDRGLIFILVPVAMIDSFSKQRLLPRRMWTLVFGSILLAAFAARLFDPQLYDDRVSNPANFYQRVAQQSETLGVVREYPLFGVGLGLYYGTVSVEPRYMVRWRGIESMTAPHSVLMTVLSEGGMIGLFLYVFAQLFLIRAMWKIRSAYPGGWLAFLYCVLAYHLAGLDFATAYYSDINLFYMFVLGIIYKIQADIAYREKLGLVLLTQSAQSIEHRPVIRSI